VPVGTGPMALRATNLGIRYNLNLTKKAKLQTSFATLLDPRRRRKGHFWALRGVNLTVSRGEAVGVVGPNGCGKSTLLLALAGIIQPSEGVVEAHGHVSTLLSLQAGFDAELSGRENIALAGALMGIDHRLMEEITPGIISFAAIGAFIDAPMKTYSSGMRARVGFSIATAVDPDILLLDEVLQTGDNKFKEKSRIRISEVLQTAKAVVMVTHDMSWITAFCTRAILLDKGHIVAEGNPDEIADMHEDDAERRLKQKRKAKQLVKHGKIDLVDIRKARKAGTLGSVAEGQPDLADDELDDEDRAELEEVKARIQARAAARAAVKAGGESAPTEATGTDGKPTRA
jgi:ABC-2 type transport system ATP-binding protein